MRKNSCRRANPLPPPADPEQILARRAHRFAREGQYRKAALVLRQLVHLQQEPRLWVRLGVMLDRARRPDEARRALSQGMFLYRQRHAHRKADVVARLMSEMMPRT